MYTIYLTELSLRHCEVIISVVPVLHTDERLWLMALSRLPKSSESVREELGLGSSQGVVPEPIFPITSPPPNTIKIFQTKLTSNKCILKASH